MQKLKPCRHPDGFIETNVRRDGNYDRVEEVCMRCSLRRVRWRVHEDRYKYSVHYVNSKTGETSMAGVEMGRYVLLIHPYKEPAFVGRKICGSLNEAMDQAKKELLHSDIKTVRIYVMHHGELFRRADANRPPSEILWVYHPVNIPGLCETGGL
jgi:hypothetical protein